MGITRTAAGRCKAFALASLFLVAASPQVTWSAPRYQALAIKAPGALALAADPRFDPSDRGTVELWLAIAPRQPDSPADDSGNRTLCIAEHGSGDALDWRISLVMSGDNDTLRFGRPAEGAQIDIPMKLRGAGYHHFAFVTAGGRTQAIVDGARLNTFDQDGTPKPGAEFGYRPAVPDGLPLTFGCAEGPTATAWVSSFRIWGTALSEDDVSVAQKSTGPVMLASELDPRLLAFSLFTDSAKEVRLANPRIAFTEYLGKGGGTPFFYRRPPGQELRAVYNRAAGDHHLAPPMVEFDAQSRTDELTRGPAIADLTLPTILPRRSTDPSGEKAAYVLAKIGVWTRTPHSEAAAQVVEQKLRTAFTRFRQEERARAFGGTDAKMLTLADFNEGGYQGFAIALRPGERFRNVIASYGAGGIAALTFGTENFERSAWYGFAEKRQDVSSLDLPPGTRLEGIAGRVSDDGSLLSLALAYSELDPTAPRSLAERVAEGVWIDRAMKMPVRSAGDDADTELEEFNGDYSNQATYRFSASLDGNVLQMRIDSGDPKIAPKTHNFVNRSDNEWAGIQKETGEFADAGDTLWLGDDAIRWGSGGSIDSEAIVLVRASPYPTADENKLSWGATFSLDHRPNAVLANFKGYNPAEMFAHDYQATSGADKLLFKMPDDASTDYISTDSRLIVPHGLYLSFDSEGSERGDALKVNSDTERHSMWSRSLGGSVEVPGIVKFAADGSYQQSQETIDHFDLSMVVNRAIVRHYALILDRSRVELSDEFRDRIIDLRNRHIAGLPIDWDQFFDNFGTYYPYAVTYGGMAWSETTMNSSQQTVAKDEDDKKSMSATFPLDEGIQVGINASSEYSQGSRSSTGSLRERTNFGTYGGSFSKGGGWSVGRGEELPVLLDLRPLPDLLSPIFFEDPAIYVDLRKRMTEEFDTHYKEIEAAAKKANPWTKQLDPNRCVGEVCFYRGGGFP